MTRGNYAPGGRSPVSPGGLPGGKARVYRTGSVRLRLTVLFASLFLVSGAGLLGITYGLVSNATNGIIVARITSGTPLGNSAPAGSGSVASGSAGSGSAGSGSAGSGAADPASGLAIEGPGAAAADALPNPEAIQAQATQYATDTRAREK